MAKSGGERDESPSQLIDARIKELGGWRGKAPSRVRMLIRQAARRGRGVEVRSSGVASQRDNLPRALDLL